ncbi:MAG: glycosyltransferase family 4 protein [Oligoflexia bacterium]|nr:glycosyltransferase family 4 protein [Oligoflexia bacterium]
MRVALLSPLFESVPPRLYGGTERVVYNLYRGLRSQGVDTVLFASGDSRVEGPLIPVIDESLRLRSAPVADPVAYHLKMLAVVADLAGDFDVIHNHHDYWMLPLTRMTRVPVLTTMHGRLDLPDLPAALGGFPGASYVSISDSQRQPLPWLRWMATIHHGIDTGPFELHRKPGRYLAFLGRISAEKRPDWAIKIAKLAGVPLKIAAKIEGKTGQDYYDAFVEPHVDGRFIEYVGEISEAQKSDFLGGALATVFPIDWPEPFGLVVLESLACGTPVLARPCGSVPELLRDGVTGFVHPDIAELARRIPDLPALDRPACREWVEARFSLKRMTEEYIDVYRRLSESSGQRRADRRRRNLLHPVQRVADGNS